MSHTAFVIVNYRDRKFTCRMSWESDERGRGWELELVDRIETLSGRVLSDEQVVRWLHLAGPDVVRDIKHEAADAADAAGSGGW